MDRFYYFTYGSNMLTERLADRCPSAKEAGTAFVEDYALEFSKRSCDKSGKATLVVSQGQRQYGVVFTIEKCDLNKLDKAEGRGKGYDRKCCFNVTMTDTGVSKSTITYIAPIEDRVTGLKPYDWYLAYVVSGAMQHKLPEAVITAYRDTDYRVDKGWGRKSKELEILKKANLGSTEQILEPK